MRVCITGANCFIGFPLVKKASELGWDVIAVIRRGNKCKLQLEQIKNVTVIELNLEEYVHLGKMTGYVDCLVMLAWGGVRGELRNDAVLQRSNYEYCLAGINSIIEYGCKRVLTAGSQAEYGIVNGIINEETPCNPVNEYGKYKLELYKSVSNICRKKEITHIEPRIFSIYGPGDYEGSLIMSIINKMRNNEVCELTQCTQVWDYLYIDDAVEALSILCQ